MKADQVYAILNNKINNVDKPTDAQVGAAVDAFLTENPVMSGATAEEHKQIYDNKESISKMIEFEASTPQTATFVEESDIQELVAKIDSKINKAELVTLLSQVKTALEENEIQRAISLLDTFIIGQGVLN